MNLERLEHDLLSPSYDLKHYKQAWYWRLWDLALFTLVVPLGTVALYGIVLMLFGLAA